MATIARPSTSLRCRLRLGHRVLNKRTYRLCSCGSKESEEDLHLNCTLYSALRGDLVQSVKSILLKEYLQDYFFRHFTCKLLLANLLG